MEWEEVIFKILDTTLWCTRMVVVPESHKLCRSHVLNGYLKQARWELIQGRSPMSAVRGCPVSACVLDDTWERN